MSVRCRHLMTGPLLAGVMLALCGPVTAGNPPPARQCRVAVVSPVSGFAECVDPRGAPVAQPPSRPPPTQEQCARHPELDVHACPQQAHTPKQPSR